MAVLPIEDLKQRPPLTGWAPFALGFRPFFLAAGLYAVLLMALWLLVLRGVITPGELPPAVWHGHEMLFGFAVAVIAGFLLTAAQNWTGIRTPSGRPLAALFLLWLAGRLGFLVPGMPPALVAADRSRLPAGARADARAAHPQGEAAAQLSLPLHAAGAGGRQCAGARRSAWATPETARLGLHLAVYVVVAMITVMGGRVIPSFTDNKLHTRARRWKTIERLVPVVTVGCADRRADRRRIRASPPCSPPWLRRCMRSALQAGTPLSSGRCRCLWILHLGYAWIALGFALLALSAAGWSTAAGHRAACLHRRRHRRADPGHDGAGVARPYRPPAGTAPVMTLAFVAINLAALIRVGLPLVFPAAYAQIMDGGRAGVDRRVRPVRVGVCPHAAAPARRRQTRLSARPAH